MRNGRRRKLSWGAVVLLWSGCAASTDFDVDAYNCGSLSLETERDYEAARECVRVEGDLLIGAAAGAGGFEFPSLTEITGKIGLRYDDLPHPLAALRLPVLKRVG